MKHISELVSTNQTTQESGGDCKKGSKPDLTMVENLFTSLYLKYQHLWSSQFHSAKMEDAALLEWGRALDGFSQRVVSRALDDCLLMYPNRPPLVGQFLALCRQRADDLPFYQSLPRPKTDERVVMGELAKMREALKA